MLKRLSIALSLLICICLPTHATINEWAGVYRGVGIVQSADSKRHEIRSELQIIEISTLHLKLGKLQ